MANKTSQHILNTSANLLGFCLVIITSLHLTDQAQNYLIDELTSVIALFLTVSSVLSFLSIRAEDTKKVFRFEKIADLFFLLSLIGIFSVIIFIIINFSSR